MVESVIIINGHAVHFVDPPSYPHANAEIGMRKIFPQAKETTAEIKENSESLRSHEGPILRRPQTISLASFKYPTRGPHRIE